MSCSQVGDAVLLPVSVPLTICSQLFVLLESIRNRNCCVDSMERFQAVTLGPCRSFSTAQPNSVPTNCYRSRTTMTSVQSRHPYSPAPLVASLPLSSTINPPLFFMHRSTLNAKITHSTFVEAPLVPSPLHRAHQAPTT